MLRNMIVYGDIKIYHSNVKTLSFLTNYKVVLRIHEAFRSVAWKPSNRSLPFFHYHTIEHQYINFWSYLNFHKMWESAGFKLGGSHFITECEAAMQKGSLLVL